AVIPAIVALIIAALMMLMMSSCASERTSAPTGAPEGAAAHPDWQEKITIVQMPNENNPDAGQKHEGFRAGLEAALGIKVEELEGSEYSVGIEAMKAGTLDVLLVSPMSYYQARRVANAEPLVTTATMGADPYKTVFITQKDRDDINTIEDMRGKSFAFVDPASSSGYMYPKAHLVTALELDADRLEQPDYFFKTVTYSGKHDSSLIGVGMGDYDAAAVAYQVIGQLDAAGIINREDYKIIGETEVIPNACYVIRAGLPDDLKEAILEYYLAYDDSGYFEAFYQSPDIRFIRAYDSDYAVVDEMVRILNIEG
ncbi:MAG: phosphate/phosphite/phosphonate ABC transporter substrate-binding protein, partial [Oscillospiraceae bacterium]|nr:phosphate/phosphite/phosphonate ABC transporter substrate-binding protein [Oscillospiraceae bacterium]